MFPSKICRRSTIALAVMTVFGNPVRADGITTSSDTALHAAQTYFPAVGTVDTERANSLTAVGPIKADAAYARGITGKNVTIAVIDSGISADHIEFSEAGKLLQGYNAITGTGYVVDGAGHGTHVAGIIGAGRGGSGMFGVAYDARLLPIKALSDNGTGSTVHLDNGLRYAIGRAAIVNISISADAQYDAAAMQAAVGSGLLIVAAAGNGAAANPSWPARFAKDAWSNNQIIAVGAVDVNNRIASFSNRAGDTAAWFLVAPGVQILSSYPNGQYVTMSGTSMAAPIVSGAAALIKQLWPSLRADQIADILFLTATDLGVPGIDAVYGRGLLNVERALQPIGAVVTTTFNGRTINVLGSTLRPSSATSKLWALAASGNLRVAGLDDFQRDFNVDLGAAVARPAATSLEQVFGRMDSRIEVSETLLAGGAGLVAAYERRLPLIGASLSGWDRSRDARLAAFSLTSRLPGGMETVFGVGGFAASYFGAGGLDLRQGMSLGAVAALDNPYFSLVPGASHAALAQEVSGVKWKLGVLDSGFSRAFASSQEGPYLPASLRNVPKANAALLEASTSLGDAALSLSFSRIGETDAYLGAQSSGALAFGRSAATSSVQLAGGLLLAPNWVLAGQAAYGVTPAVQNGDSLFTEISGIHTNAFSVALIASDRINKGDRLTFALSQPMRAYAGQMAMDVLTGMDSSGAQQRERLHFSMVPLGRELKTELNYLTPAGRDASMGVTFLLRHEPNHLADAPAEKLLAMRYTKQF